MRTYHAFSTAAYTPGGAGRTAIMALAAAARGFWAKRFWITCNTTTSAVLEVVIQRYTGTGTGSALTPAPLDPTDVAFSGAEVEYNYTAEPAAGTVLWRGHWNVTVPFDLVLPPGDEIWVPGAAATQGVGLYLPGVPAANIHVGMVLTEP